MNDADKKVLDILKQTELYSQSELDSFVSIFNTSLEDNFLKFLIKTHLLTKPETIVEDELVIEDSGANLIQEEDDFIPATDQQTLMNFGRGDSKSEKGIEFEVVRSKDSETSDKKSSSVNVSDYLKDAYQIDSSVNLQAPVDNGTMLDLGTTKKTKIEKTKSSEALGKHFVTGEIGRGGMGAVLSVFDNDLQRELAAKVILTGREASKFELEKFLIEAQITGQLEHPNIVPVHEINISNDKRIFFTMKYVRGKSLQGLLQSEFKYLQRKNLPPRMKYWDLGKLPDVMSLNEKLDIFIKICDALAFAHSKGVIHRDLKPANVMVGEFGEVQVMDWGLAKVVGLTDSTENAVKLDLNKGDVISDARNGDDSAPLVTVDGRIVGTPAYMPPEQANGDIHLIDERSDIYAIGVILYEMLTYQLPYEGASAWEIVGKVTSQDPLTPSERTAKSNLPAPPRELEAIVMKAMSKKRELRYKSVKDLRNEISRFLEGHTVGAADYSSWQLFAKWVKRNKAFVTSFTVIIAVAIVFAVISFINISNALKSETEQRQIAEEAKDQEAKERVRAEREKQNAIIQEKKALASEAETARALKKSQDNLCLAYAKASESALNEGNIPAAMLFAGKWLSIREDKAARNICLNHMNQPMRIKNQLWHVSNVKQAQFNKDSSILLTVADGAYLWSSKGNLIAKIAHDENELSFARFSPDESRILTASWYVKGKCWGKDIKIWNLKGELINTLKHESYVGLINFSADGKKLLTSTFEYDEQEGQLTKGKDGVKIWGFDGSLLKTIPMNNEVVDANFSVDGKLILIISLKKHELQDRYLSTITIKNLADDEEVKFENEGFVYFAKFVGLSNSVCISTYNYELAKGFLKIYSLDKTEKLKLEINNENLRVDFTKDGEAVVVNNLKPGVCTLIYFADMKKLEFEHENKIQDCKFTDFDKKLVVKTAKNIYLWDIESVSKITFQHKNNISNYAISGDNKSIAVAVNDMFYLWNTSGELIYSTKMPENIEQIIFTRNSSELLILSGSIAYLWDLSEDLDNVLWHETNISNLNLVNSEGSVLTYSSEAGRVYFWDLDGKLIFSINTDKGLFGVLESQKEIFTVEANTLMITDFKGNNVSKHEFEKNIVDVKASNNGETFLILVEGDEFHYLVNIKTDKASKIDCLQTANSPKFSNTGKLLTVVQDDESKMNLVVFNLKHKELTRIDVSNLLLKDILFTHDDKYIIAYDYSGSLVCKQIGGSQYFKLDHGEGINFVTVSKDSKYILVSSFGFSKLYTMDGSNLGTIKHEGEITFAEFSVDGQTVLIAGQQISLWKIGGEKLLDFENTQAYKFIINAKIVDSSTVFIATNNALTLWNNSGSIIYNIEIDHPIIFADYLPTIGKFIAAYDNELRIWDINLVSEDILMKQRYKTGFTLRGMNIAPEQRYLLTSKMLKYIEDNPEKYKEFLKENEEVLKSLNNGEITNSLFVKLADNLLNNNIPALKYIFYLKMFNSLDRSTALKMFLTEEITKQLNTQQFRTQTSKGLEKYQMLQLIIEACMVESMIDNPKTLNVDEKKQKVMEISTKANQLIADLGSNEILQILTQN